MVWVDIWGCWGAAASQLYRQPTGRFYGLSAGLCGWWVLFFTVALANREGNLLVQHIETLRAAFKYVKERHPFKIDAMVVLPDHLHCIWTLPEGDCDYAKRWALIKIYFSKKIPQTERVNASRVKKGERGVWQRRFWEHVIRDERDYLNHMEYIHINPIKHGYVLNAIDWPYSSIHKYNDRNLN